MEELLDYEKKHISFLEKNAHEGTLFLKRNNEFPIKKPCKTVLVGNGARQTIKGGTGSGDVASRFFVNFEKGLKDAGFEITSTEWLDKYDEFQKGTVKDYIKGTKKLAKEKHTFTGMFAMGFFDTEKNYDFEPIYDGEICVYVLARNCGEGNDRRNIEGDVKLSSREIKDILSLNKKFKKFLLVLNVGGVVDLTPVINDVENILYISQLGVVTGSILPKIILGKVNPSGKLTTTWAKPEDYPFFNEFGDQHDTCYKEGVYVGYRYFDSVKKDPYFPFGFGLSYTNFKIEDVDASLNKEKVTVKCKVTNIGNYSGKEVVQVYVSAPQGKIYKPYQSLVGFNKTKLLKPNEEEILEVSFKVKDLTCYDEKNACYLLEKGNYIIRVGSSSRDTVKIAYIALDKDIIVEQCKNNLGASGFDDFLVKLNDESVDGLKCLKFDSSSIKTKNIVYEKDIYKDPEIEKLTNDELVLMCLGAHKSSIGSVFGNNAVHLIGGAGETTLNVNSIKDSLTMADGPAGLRLRQIYGVDEKGIYDVTLDPVNSKVNMFLPKIVAKFLEPPKNRHGVLHYQYTTAIPIGTSLAMAFNNDYLYKIGCLIAEEMDIFNVNLWLAPAMNIHRNILCGRNFEYFSEDPFVTGTAASAITKGVQSHASRGVTIKHFCCNNQELNRNNNNSHVSERAIREIYLRGFELCIKQSAPKALMTSYNLLNGKHTSENYGLINNILRCEWGYQGLVMTDWITSGISWCFKCKYPAPYADNIILAGNDLTMSGSKKDEKYIRKSLKSGKLTRNDLINSASRIYRSIKNK